MDPDATLNALLDALADLPGFADAYQHAEDLAIWLNRGGAMPAPVLVARKTQWPPRLWGFLTLLAEARERLEAREDLERLGMPGPD